MRGPYLYGVGFRYPMKYFVEFEPNSLEDYIQSAVDRGGENSGGASVREIQIVCEKAYDRALQNGTKIVKFEDIAKAAISEFRIG